MILVRSTGHREADASPAGVARAGYSATQSLKSYAMYLDSRITCYRALKHDPIRVQSENNRMSVYDGPAGGEWTHFLGGISGFREGRMLILCKRACV